MRFGRNRIDYMVYCTIPFSWMTFSSCVNTEGRSSKGKYHHVSTNFYTSPSGCVWCFGRFRIALTCLSVVSYIYVVDPLLNERKSFDFYSFFHPKIHPNPSQNTFWMPTWTLQTKCGTSGLAPNGLSRRIKEKDF